mgnify:CR=1 FL=1|tara:strand:+ start:195 stop:575 length:381 start_codon:yes stop_codon:yes gene_type:complete
MSNITTQAIRDCKKAVNQAKFNPTKARKAQAIKLLTELAEAVSNLEEVAPTPKRKPKRKAKRKVSKNQKLEAQAQKQSAIAENFIPEAVADVNTLPEFSELRSMGYSVEDAVRYCKALMDGAPQVA